MIKDTPLIDWLNQENEVILGSGSPRRSELLKQAGVKFSVLKSTAEEVYPEDLSATEVATFLSQLKALDLKDQLNEKNLLVTADTTVVLGGSILNKPEDKQQAYEMLKQLSGKSHIVITGVSLLKKDWENCITFKENTFVHFNTLQEDEIEHYVEKYQPYDKAGAYGIQEWMGLIGIKGIEGDYFNVVGLPVQRLYAELLALFTQEK